MLVYCLRVILVIWKDLIIWFNVINSIIEGDGSCEIIFCGVFKFFICIDLFLLE